MVLFFSYFLSSSLIHNVFSFPFPLALPWVLRPPAPPRRPRSTLSETTEFRQDFSATLHAPLPPPYLTSRMSHISSRLAHFPRLTLRSVPLHRGADGREIRMRWAAPSVASDACGRLAITSALHSEGGNTRGVSKERAVVSHLHLPSLLISKAP